MIIKNIDAELISPFGEALILDQQRIKNEKGEEVVVNRAMTLRHAIGMCCMYQGTQEEQLSVDEKKRQFSITEALVNSDNNGSSDLTIYAEDVLFLRNAADKCLVGIPSGYLNKALDEAEGSNVEAIKMS